MLSIKNLHASRDNKNIIKGINLSIHEGEVHVIVGPNGGGKSTLGNIIIGNPLYEVQKGSVHFCGKNITKLSPDLRAKMGVFLAFQTPREIDGIEYFEFLRMAYNEIKGQSTLSIFEFKKLLEEKLKEVHLQSEFLNRSLNTGFSGGEKKKAEILQLLLFEPKLAILDEIDSGLDVDALKDLIKALQNTRKKCPKMSFLIITHHQKILEHIKPDYVHLIIDGKIVESGTKTLATKIAKEGFKKYMKSEKKSLSVL